jgi:hypothetical protein
MSEPNRCFIDTLGLAERRITFHLTARRKCEVNCETIKITIHKMDECLRYSSTLRKLTPLNAKYKNRNAKINESE